MSDREPLHEIDFDEDDGMSASTIELEKIPRALWEQTLAALHRQDRSVVILKLADEQLQGVAWEIADEIARAESRRVIARQEARGRALRGGVPVPAPGADHAVSRSTVQVNLRPRGDDYARLTEAAPPSD
ncbi:MAG: hypothetical protein WKF42_07750 [Solirubrobacteraceae bacterium]